MFDSYGRRVHYLRISVTDRCNFRCRYCMPPKGVEWLPHDSIISYERIVELCRVAAGLGFDKLRLTGGEPLVRRGIVDLVAALSRLPGIAHLGLTTNGSLLAPLARPLAAAGLGSVNVSLDTLDPDRYAAVTRGGRLADTLEGIRQARAAGLPVKLNVVVSEPLSEPLAAAPQAADRAPPAADLAALEAFAAEHGCAIQTIREYRLDQTKSHSDAFMRPPPCADCNRIRLLATGQLKPCLHGDAVQSVDWQDIAGSIRACVALKPACGQSASRHLVSSIGG